MKSHVEWKLYHNALIPRQSPIEPELTAVNSRALWKEYPKALFIRYTTNFDCEEKTEWWYVVKDEPMDLGKLNSKRRYEITKGNRNYEVRRIDSVEYQAEMYRVTQAAYGAYPEKYRPDLTEESFAKTIADWPQFEVYGGFSRENNELCAYAMVRKNGNWADFCVLHVDPACEKKAVNAAMVYGILLENEEYLKNGGYICDGNRTIRHESAFQNYLEKYFGFRKAYCKLHIIFRPGIGLVVKMLFPFRKILRKFDHIGIIHNVNSVLTMKTYAVQEVAHE